jgi:glycosyltransferase involved in cell wall biosynthesis
MLLISIVTPSYNQGIFLERNLRSVLNQSYKNFEHIVIDGESEDDTMAVLIKYRHLKWVSENDGGQAHAVNKGLRMAKGDVIGWLNSDDLYVPETFKRVNTIFSNDDELDFIFSNCLIIDENDRITGYLRGKDPEKYSVLNNCNFIAQPTVFFRRRVLEITGYLNESYNLSMYIDYWRRISKSHKMRFVDDIFACFRIHSDSKTSLYRREFKTESKRSFFKNGGSIFSPYYFETFIKPKIIFLTCENFLIKKLFYKNKH